MGSSRSGEEIQEEVENGARIAAATIDAVTVGDRALVSTWVKSARELGASVMSFRSTKGLDHDPGFYDWRTQRIFYNRAAPTDKCIRYIVHELAHHVVAQWRFSQLRSGVERYDGNRQTLQHRIARRVEEILLG